MPTNSEPNITPENSLSELVLQKSLFKYHLGSITTIATCNKRSIVVSCGVDKSLHIWNFLDKSEEFVKYFPEEPLAYKIIVDI